MSIFMFEVRPDMSVIDLVSFLRSPILRTRTGILLIPPRHLGNEKDIAVQLGIDALDYREYILQRLPREASFVALDASTIIEDLDAVATANQGLDCIFIYNFDLAISKLNTATRALIWNDLRDNFPHRRRALILAMPDSATNLLPDAINLETWKNSRRISSLVS